LGLCTSYTSIHRNANSIIKVDTFMENQTNTKSNDKIKFADESKAKEMNKLKIIPKRVDSRNSFRIMKNQSNKELKPKLAHFHRRESYNPMKSTLAIPMYK
jgi:hypothetical protein